ncbi:MAG: hypothetical protein V4773_04720 [Verrucomicrobiota bacterium]
MALGAAEKDPLPAVDDKWRHYRSPNFELYSHTAERESRQLLHDLETLRGVFVERFKFVERARVDVTVFLFRTEEEFKAYGSNTWTKDHQFRGVYLEGRDRATISLAPAADEDAARRLIFHEYVHHLFRAAELDPPLWFNEGMAELLAGIQTDGGKVEIGHPQVGRLVALQHEKLLPLETLFTVDHGSPIYRSNDHTGMFYAQSWALLHYWYFGQSKIPKEAVTRFTTVAGDRKAAAEVDLRKFFRECFSMDYPEMQRQLEWYVSTGSYRYGREPTPKIPAAPTYATRAVARDEIRPRLAELLARINRSELGKFILVDAAAKADRDPRIFEALGAIALMENDEAKARERWEEALAAGSTNQAIYRELTRLETRDWFRDFDYYFRLPLPTVARLRARLKRAIEYEPLQTTAYELLAWVEAFAEAPYVPNVNLVQGAFPRLKQKQRTLLALVLIRLHSDMKEPALQLLKDINHFEWDAWAAQSAEVVLAKLEDRPVRPINERRVDNELLVEVTSDPLGLLKYPSVRLPEAR